MSVQRVSRPVSVAVEAVIPAKAQAKSPVFRGKISLFGAFAAVAAVAAFVLVAALPAKQANSTLKCYDSSGNGHPCLTLAASSPSQPTATSFQSQPPATSSQSQPPAISSQSQPTRRTAELASWTTAPLDQVGDHRGNWTASTPTLRHSVTGKRLAPSRCGRRLLPCFFSAVEKGVRHIALVAAAMGRTRPQRERL